MSDELREALKLALPIVEADHATAKEQGDADWEGQSHTALEAIRAALAKPLPPTDDVRARLIARLQRMLDSQKFAEHIRVAPSVLSEAVAALSAQSPPLNMGEGLVERIKVALENRLRRIPDDYNQGFDNGITAAKTEVVQLIQEALDTPSLPEEMVMVPDERKALEHALDELLRRELSHRSYWIAARIRQALATAPASVLRREEEE